MKFTLEIELGNDGMQTVDDVQDAIQAFVSSQTVTRNVAGNREFERGDGGKIRDFNGNTVGKWEVTD